jgi:hypothetical protein
MLELPDVRNPLADIERPVATVLQGVAFRARAHLLPIHPGRPLAKKEERRERATSAQLGLVGSTSGCFWVK